jgi:hypothetical protein
MGSARAMSLEPAVALAIAPVRSDVQAGETFGDHSLLLLLAMPDRSSRMDPPLVSPDHLGKDGCSLAGSASVSAMRDSIDIRCQLAGLLNFVGHGEGGLGEFDPLREVSRLRQER